MKLDGKINTINSAVVCSGTKGATTIGTRVLIASDFQLVEIMRFFYPVILNR